MSILDPSLAQKKAVSAVENAVEKGDTISCEERFKIDKQTVRRLDLLLLPMVCVIYLLGYIDRANVGSLRAAWC